MVMARDFWHEALLYHPFGSVLPSSSMLVSPQDSSPVVAIEWQQVGRLASYSTWPTYQAVGSGQGFDDCNRFNATRCGGTHRSRQPTPASDPPGPTNACRH